MANTLLDSYTGPAANAGSLIQAAGGIRISKADEVALDKLREDLARIAEKQSKLSRDEAAKHVRAVKQRAIDEPSPENLAALNGNSFADVAARYDRDVESLAAVQNDVLKKAKPLVARIRDAAIKILDQEIDRVTNEQRAAFARLGVPFDPNHDPLVLSVVRSRDTVNASLSNEGGATPKRIVRLVGPIKAK